MDATWWWLAAYVVTGLVVAGVCVTVDVIEANDRDAPLEALAVLVGWPLAVLVGAGWLAGVVAVVLGKMVRRLTK